MKFKSVIRWMFLIALTATVVTGGVSIHYWNQRHDLVESQLRHKFDRFAPDLRLILGQVRFHDLHWLTLGDVEVRDRATDQPLLRAGRVSIRIEPQTLLDHQRVIVRSVQVDGAEVLLVRQEDARWNWQNYEYNPADSGGGTLPHIDLRQLSVLLHLKHGNGIPPARLMLTSPQIQIVPASAHSLDVDGVVEVAGAGALSLTGNCDLASGAWSLQGRMKDMTADRKLLELAQTSSPLVRTRLQRLEQTVQKFLPSPQTVSVNPDPDLTIGLSSFPRIQGQLDVDFNIQKRSEQEDADFQLMVDISDGQLAFPGLPIGLSEVNAEFFSSNDQVSLRVHQAQSEGSHLSGEFRLNTAQGSAPPSGLFQFVNFHVGPRLKPLCSPKVQKLFEGFQPDLRVSGRGQLIQRMDGRWALSSLNAKVTDGRLLHHRFRYPLTGIQATLSQRPLQQTNGDVVIDVEEATGFVGTHHWSATGWWKNPGPAVESHFVMDVSDFPLDGRFREALEPVGRRVVESLNLSGLITVKLQFDRPAGIGNKTRLRIFGRVYDVTLRFTGFPYPIDRLSGHVTFDSQTALWEFRELHGRHDETEIFGSGKFTGLPRPGVLDLTVEALRLRLDSDLYNALAEPQQRLWQLMDPSGYCDLTAEIDWTTAPGQKAVVRFPEETPVRFYDAKIRPRPFPYEMDVEEAKVSFNPNDPRFSGVQYCDIQSFRASHRNAPIVATGWAMTHSDGQWQVHLDHLTASQLPPDDDLRAALPDKWREILTRLHQQGRISVEDSEIDFKGTQRDGADVTAGWDMTLHLHDCSLSAGLDLEDVSGHLTAAGTWDGLHLKNDGAIEIDSTRVLGMPLTRIQGPYSIDDAKLVLGTQQVFESGQLEKLDQSQRLTARAYGGTLFLDAVVDSRPRSSYQMFAELKDASLQSFAHENLDVAKNLHGNVTAWLALKGAGESADDLRGSGQLEISPAALYELPVVLELLRALTSLNSVNRNAFDYAMLAFDVRNRRFAFKQVDLVGESMALRGRGSIGFGGDVELDFYSRPSRSRPRIGNLISNLLLNSATQWAKVEVSGTTERPKAILRPTAQLDDSVRQFLNAFNPAAGNVPRLVVPRVFPFAGSPMSFGPFPFQR